MPLYTLGTYYPVVPTPHILSSPHPSTCPLF
jgi:hypothetical protein